MRKWYNCGLQILIFPADGLQIRPSFRRFPHSYLPERMRYSLTTYHSPLTTHLLPLTSKSLSPLKPLHFPLNPSCKKISSLVLPPHSRPFFPFGQRKFSLWPNRFFSLAYQQILYRDNTVTGTGEHQIPSNISASFFANWHPWVVGWFP